jgi:hypothetical protein
MGFIPKHIVDVANHGTWTRESYNSFSGCLLHFAGTSKLVKKSFQDILDANSKVNFIQLVQVQKKVRFILRLWIEMIVVF